MATKRVELLRNDQLMRCTLAIQKVWRVHTSQKEAAQRKHSVILIQSLIRLWVVRKHLNIERTKAAVTKISAAWRCHRCQTLFKVTIASKPIMHAFVLD